jgi:hypothetical protein
VLLSSLLAGAVGCQNAGEGNILSISATGVVNGLVFVDRNGNRTLDLADTILSNLPVRLVARGTRDTVAKGASSATGAFHFTGVPIGGYAVAVDTTLLGDSLRITRLDSATLTVRPNDTISVQIGVSFPQLTIPQARVAPVGKKLFVVGVALDSRGIFGDTTVNLSDSTAAIRLTAVRTLGVSAGDSVRAFGTRSTRDGQPTLNQVTVYALNFGAATPLFTISTVKAAAADSGRLDAALVRVTRAIVSDTATVMGGRRLTVSDGSGALQVQLDTLVGFRGAVLVGDTVVAKLDIAGLLFPAGTGTWLLKPRAPSDVARSP